MGDGGKVTFERFHLSQHLVATITRQTTTSAPHTHTGKLAVSLGPYGINNVAFGGVGCYFCNLATWLCSLVSSLWHNITQSSAERRLLSIFRCERFTFPTHISNIFGQSTTRATANESESENKRDMTESDGHYTNKTQAVTHTHTHR